MGNQISKRVRVLLKKPREKGKYALPDWQVPSNVTVRQPYMNGNESDPDIGVLDTSRVIEGRRFQNDNQRYLMPCDTLEQRRLEGQHDIFRDGWNGNFSAPIRELLSQGGARVLDVGCGPGTWIVDMANDFPGTTFLGLDMAPLFPTEGGPSNAGFLQFNILNGLPFPTDTFDLTYMRFMWAAFTERQWAQVIEDLARVTKINSYVEIMEFELELYNSGPVSKKLLHATRTALHSKGMNPVIAPIIPKIMAKTGRFNEVTIAENYTYLLDKALEDFLAAMLAFQVALKAVMGVGDDEYRDMLTDFSRECNKHRTQVRTFRFYATKAADSK